MSTVRLTMAQALIRYLQAQLVERDGVEQPFFGGVFGIFGHGNVAGVGQALLQARDRLPYVLVRNEQAMVHTAIAYAKRKARLQEVALRGLPHLDGAVLVEPSREGLGERWGHVLGEGDRRRQLAG